MGGILIVLALVFSTMLWAQWNAQVELTMLSVLVLAGLGFYDDYAKILKQSGGGTPPRVKLITQFALAAFVGIYLWNCRRKANCICSAARMSGISNLVSSLMLPFYKYPIHIGAVARRGGGGAGDCRQLERGEFDGRPDGLAIGCTLIVGVCVFGFHLSGGQREDGGVSADSVCAGRGRTDGVLRGAASARGWDFCGSTAIRRRCSWATPARSRSAARSASWRC